MSSLWYSINKRFIKMTSQSPSKATKEVYMTITQKDNSKVQDITGNKYNLLTAVAYVGTHNSKAYWLYLCECGGDTVRRTPETRLISKTSCGCERAKKTKLMAKKYLTTHGATGTPTHRAWLAMKNRCRPTHGEKHLYFDRGIAVCNRWAKSYPSFLKDMGEKPKKGYSLDRIDNDKGYSPDNCRWATGEQQAKNRRVTKFVDYNGELMTLREISKKVGISYKTLWLRQKEGRKLSGELWER